MASRAVSRALYRNLRCRGAWEAARGADALPSVWTAARTTTATSADGDRTATSDRRPPTTFLFSFSFSFYFCFCFGSAFYRRLAFWVLFFPLSFLCSGLRQTPPPRGAGWEPEKKSPSPELFFRADGVTHVFYNPFLCHFLIFWMCLDAFLCFPMC